MKFSLCRSSSTVVFVFFITAKLQAQAAPAIGYMYPPGGSAGQTVEVVLGGYDWTPDMEVFVHDQRIMLEIVAPIGPVIVPEPPYWFGKKSRRAPFLLPREARARLTIPAGVPSGIVQWQAANANGATATGRFMVGYEQELLEDDTRTEPQRLPSLPVTVSGQIMKIEEVDRFKFTATKTGPVSCSLLSRELNSPLNAAMEIHDAEGRKIATAFDTAGNDTALTFHAQAEQSYIVSLYDIDFRGNREFVYRLHVAESPRVVTSIPAAGQRGATQSVEFIGYGIATGAAILESVMREVSFSGESAAESFSYQLETPFGTTSAYSIQLSDLPEAVESTGIPQTLSVPGSLTGVLGEKFETDEYLINGIKGDAWTIRLLAEEIGSPLDVALTISDADGKELARSDDAPNTTDAGLHFSVPADGAYKIGISDLSGHSGNRAAAYRLVAEATRPYFTFTVPELLNAPLGDKAKLAVKVTRTPGFKEPISLSFINLPAGVTVPAELEIPAGKSDLSVELDVAADAAASASLVTIQGKSIADNQSILQQTSSPILIAMTIKPPFSIDAEGQDDVTKWPRGCTFPASVLIERDAGFEEVIRLEMAAKQGRHRQGISGPELDVPPGVQRILYPVFLPEWLETTRTSRMVVNGVAKVTDPIGNVRYSLTRQKTRMGFLPTGALLKIAAEKNEFLIIPGETFNIPISVHRSSHLKDPVQLELLTDGTLFSATPITLSEQTQQVQLPIAVNSQVNELNEYNLMIRATVLRDGKFPIVSQTTVTMIFKQPDLAN
ncbi:hypothetical protein OAF42_02085 [Planctomicrobium sp.]|nr:hypothetical protein [Planctomicrobium sp.]MDB4733212.1 hypothetical protein [Planctomicrobium sp.]